MEHVWLLVLGLAVVLGLSVTLLPVANRLRFPYTVMLALLGVFLGVVGLISDNAEGFGIVADFFTALNGIELSADAVMFVFLPVLVFESSLSIDVRRLMDDIGSILLLAIVGLLISTFVIGYSISAISGFSIVLCLLLGAIVSATDPVAVVAIFKDLGAPKRLAILVEGESLFNDATAIVLFTILAAMLTGSSEPDLLGGAFSFVKVFVGGIIVGYVLARLVCFFIGAIRDLPLVEITLTVCLSYLAFVVAEHYLHVSGVMAVLTAALVLGSVGRTAISPVAWHALTDIWEQLGFWANSLIFVLVGLIVPKLLVGMGLAELGYLVVLIVVGFGVRLIIIYGVLEAFSKSGIAAQVSKAYKTVMFWGGLRGAVSLALALAVLENPVLDETDRNFVATLVTGFVLFTLFVNATTMRLVMGLLGLDKLTASEMAIRDRAVELSLTGIAASLESAAQAQNVDAARSGKVVSDCQRRAAEARKAVQNLEGVTDDQWLEIGLLALADQERKDYLRYLEHGYIAAPVARLLLGLVDDILDGLKAEGVDGYFRVIEKTLGFSWRFRLCLRLHRLFGWTGPLTQRLVDRFEVLLTVVAVLKAEAEGSLLRVEAVVGSEAAEQLKSFLLRRLEMTERALEALRLQYPTYAAALDEWLIGRIAIRLEHSDYKDLLEGSVISHEVYSNLEGDLDARSRAVETLPPLDLGLEPRQLVGKVPYFRGLGEDQIGDIAALLKPRLALPGETVIHKGTVGDAMYFLANGAVSVDLGEKLVTLGSGEFFGEIALVAHRPRVATVRAETFCDLLVLYSRDFKRMLQSHPKLDQTIRDTAAERIGSL